MFLSLYRVVFGAFFLFLLLSVNSALGDESSLDENKIGFTPVPSWVELQQVPQLAAASELVDLDYLLYSHQENIAVAKKSSFARMAMQVNTQQGLADAAKIELGFVPAFQKLFIHQVYVIRDGKQIDKLDKSNIKLFQLESELEQGMYQETWQALLILDDVRIGDQIHYSYSLVGSNPILGDKHFGGTSLNFYTKLVKFYYRLMLPADEYIQYQVKNADVEVSERVEANLKVIEIKQNDTPVVLVDERVPHWYDPYGRFEYSQYKNWHEVNQWAMELYPSTEQLPEELKDKLAQQSFDSELEAISFITTWIQDNVRYFGIETGINSHKPSLPLDTLNRRYGDCKDKTVLLNAALRHLGIDARPALVSSVETYTLKDRLPSPGAFNHVISYFEYDDKSYWVDATMSGQKGEINEHSFPDLKWGLVVKPKSTALSAMEPVDEKQVSAKVSSEHTLELDEKGQVNLAVKTHYSGWRANHMRSYLGRVGLSTATEEFQEYFSQYFDNVSSLTPVKVSELADNRLLVESEFLLTDALKASTTRNELVIYAGQIISEVKGPQSRQRKDPLALSGKIEIDLTVKVVPNSMDNLLWSKWFVKEPVKVSSPWFEYSASVTKKERQVELDFKYKSEQETVGAKDYAKYMGKVDEIDKSLAYSLWFRKPEQQQRRDRDENVRNFLQDLMNE